MQFEEFMNDNYKGLSLTPDFYHRCEYGIHVELGNDIYQLNDDGKLNMERFYTIYRQVAEIIPLLFQEIDDVFVVANSYPLETSKAVYPNFFQRYVQNQNLKYSLYVHDLDWQFDEDTVSVQQMKMLCKVSDLKLNLLLKALIHKDFGSLRPQLRKKYSLYAPDIFVVNVRTKSVFHLYDDRGCEIINADVEIHEKLLDYFKCWSIQFKSLS